MKSHFLLILAFTFATTLTFGQDSSAVSSALTRVESYIFNQPDSALYFLNQARDLSKSENGVEMAQVYRYYGIYYHIISKYDSALRFYQLSADISNENGEDLVYADATNNMGLALSAQGNLGLAQEKLLEALTYYQQEKLTDNEANTYNNIGIVLQKSGDLHGAKSSYKKANTVYQGTHYDALSNLATVYENENNLDSALSIYDTLAVAFQRANNLRSLFSVYSNMAIVYVKKQNDEKAIYCNKLSASLAKQIDHKAGLAIVYQNLADFYYKTDQTTLSYAYLDSGFVAASDAGNLEVFAKLKNREAELDSKTGKYEKAVRAYKSYNQLRDSLYQQVQAAVVQELNIKYEAVSNQQKIAELELQRKSAALSLARSNNQRNIFLLGFTILVILAGFFFFLYQTKKKTSDILSHKNLQISEALADRETLLKEIHHRVKNNLQVISSLLNLQAGSLEDEAAIDAVRQGQHRVKSMALIHQRLYSTDDVRGVDIQDYFESLFIELFNAFGVKHDQVEYEVTTSGLKLDIDTVIPLGLIVNELITNSIKYAFSGIGQGKIIFSITRQGDKLYAYVSDNGQGMNEESMQKANSFGWKMMRSLARKLKAEIHVNNDSGTRVDLIISRFKLVA